MKTTRHFWHLAQFFPEGNIFQTEVVEKLKHILYSATILENRAFYETMWGKNGTARRATDDNTTDAHCMVDI